MENSPLSPDSQNITPITIDSPPTIPLSVAIARADAWRSMVSSLPSSPSASKAVDSPPGTGLVPQQLIFRAINIRMDDISWLISEHPDASSIRIYMSLPDANLPYQICGMLVPVDAQNNDMLTLGSDANIPLEDMMNDPANSTVYDFTQPCPSVCNTQSPLFNAGNNVDPYLRYKK